MKKVAKRFNRTFSEQEKQDHAKRVRLVEKDKQELMAIGELLKNQHKSSR